MANFYGYKRLTKVDDWRGLAGDDKWVAGRSAYELAHGWQPCGGLPQTIRAALDASQHKVLHGLTVDLCLVEKPVFLDTHIGPSMTDLMAYGRNSKGDAVVLAVEGKVDEPFGPPISAWVCGDQSNPVGTPARRPTRVRRLQFLSKHLGKDISPDSSIRYQLLHRTVSAVLEAQLHSAVAAMVMVHAFGPDAPENLTDFSAFIDEFGSHEVSKGVVYGPYRLGEQCDLPTYFLWWQRDVF